jgi:nucleoside-diphosphate-sugar epimerase
VAVALVLGARGFLGRAVAAALAREDGLDLVESDLPGSGSGPAFAGLDLAADPDEVAATLAAIRPDVIVNCAGRTAGDEAQLTAANVDTVERLLDGVRRSGLRPRLVHIGSAAEYGVVTPGRPVNERTAAVPVGPYGATKLAATRLMVAARAEGLVQGVVLRVFNAVGPGMPPDSLPGAALRRLVTARDKGQARIEMGPLGAVRDFTDVRDIAAAVVSACSAPTLAVPVVNVGTGRPHTARDLVVAMARQVGFEGGIGERATGSARSGEVPWMVADVSLARRMLGWRASHDLDAVAAYVVAGIEGSR